MAALSITRHKKTDFRRFIVISFIGNEKRWYQWADFGWADTRTPRLRGGFINHQTQKTDFRRFIVISFIGKKRDGTSGRT
ncbi:hypothetical protein [Alteromonas lipotrueae]|uniref:hypothetical protein n=1 Tax=Alteromonas lipotrueae TaxID=2803814 RepID=UPI001C43D9C7|nr:hypothetical protein [Alteromonas lipotrueae]